MEKVANASSKAASIMELEDRYGAHNYHPMPVVIERGEGVFLWDMDGKRYYDFLSAYSAVNQGHCHPDLIKVVRDQVGKLTLTSRAYYNNVLGKFEKYITTTFGYDKVLPMNTGAEAVETAIKLCRKWAYEKKKVESREAKIIVCHNNFHGRTTTIVSFSSDPEAKNNFGPFGGGFISIPYGDIEALKHELKDSHVAGFLVEPIQGEAGVMVPPVGYLKEASDACREAGVLFIADEIQTGIARTGKMLACDHEGVRPDILILGKALAGGMYPVSAVLADDGIMMVIKPGQHGSTFGGNPLAAAISIEALEIVKREKLAENSAALGEIFRTGLKDIASREKLITIVRGKGLLNAIVINDSPDSETAWNLCLTFMEKGLLAKPTHGNIIRLAPPLVITKDQINDCLKVISSAIQAFRKAS